VTGCHITTRVNGDTVDFQKPIDDPFVRQTVVVDNHPFKRFPRLFRRMFTIEVIIGADAETVKRWFSNLDNPVTSGYTGSGGGGSGTETQYTTEATGVLRPDERKAP